MAKVCPWRASGGPASEGGEVRRPGWDLLARAAVGLGVFLPLAALAQAPQDNAPPQELPAPRKLAPDAPTPVGPQVPAVGVTLPDALRVAVLSNLDIAQARTVVGEAQAARQRAEVLLLPNATFGSAYNNHAGGIQKTEGNIIRMDRDSLFVGGGPTLSFGLADALFAPGFANRVLAAAAAGERRVTNDTLLAVADAYFAVLRARRRLARIDEVLDFLTSEQRIDLRANAQGLLPLITAFVREGFVRPVDLERTRVEVLRRQEERALALQDLRVAIAELARLLHQDPTVILWPLEDFRVALPVPGDGWFVVPLPELVAAALNNRPEIAENRALVEAAVARTRAAVWRPLLPTAAVSYSAGGFGGGPPIVGVNAKGSNIFGLSGQIANFGSRADFDAGLVWQLRNLGFGNLAEVRELRAARDRFAFRELQVTDAVVAQVVQAQEQVQRTRERLEISRAALFDEAGRPTGPVYRSLRLNFLRILGGGGLPLEVLDSIRSLSDLLDAYSTAMTDFERARFRLLIALGLPAPGILDPRLLPAPPCPPLPDALPPPAQLP
jgi:outer membrane protein TolC